MSNAAEVVRQWTDAFNRQDVDAVANLYAPSAMVWDPQYAEPLEGRDAIRRDLEDFFRAFPDLTAEIRSILEGDDLYATEGTFSGTHAGVLATESGEIPPTGRRLEFQGAGFTRLDGQGRILEERRYYDLAGILAQVEVTT